MDAGRYVAECQSRRIVRPPLISTERGHASISLPDKVVTGVRCERTRLAKRRDRAHDNLRIELAHIFIVEAHAANHPGSVILHEYIDLRYEIAHDRFSFEGLHIDAQTHLAAILLNEIGAPLVSYVRKITRKITIRRQLD